MAPNRRLRALKAHAVGAALAPCANLAALAVTPAPGYLTIREVAAALANERPADVSRAEVRRLRAQLERRQRLSVAAGGVAFLTRLGDGPTAPLCTTIELLRKHAPEIFPLRSPVDASASDGASAAAAELRKYLTEMREWRDEVDAKFDALERRLRRA